VAFSMPWEIVCERSRLPFQSSRPETTARASGSPPASASSPPIA